MLCNPMYSNFRYNYPVLLWIANHNPSLSLGCVLISQSVSYRGLVKPQHNKTWCLSVMSFQHSPLPLGTNCVLHFALEEPGILRLGRYSYSRRQGSLHSSPMQACVHFPHLGTSAGFLPSIVTIVTTPQPWLTCIHTHHQRHCLQFCFRSSTLLTHSGSIRGNWR